MSEVKLTLNSPMLKNPESILSSGFMKDFGLVLVNYIKGNFMAQGRPDRWRPSRAAIKESRLTNIDTGKLFNSINFTYENETYTIFTNVNYAPFVNDERPFMIFDYDYVLDQFKQKVVSMWFKGVAQ